MSSTTSKKEASRPFGSPAFRARTKTTVLDADDCLAPVDFVQAISSRSEIRASVLMESAAQGSPVGTQSLVIPGGAVQLQTRGGEASFRPLAANAYRVLEALTPRLPEASAKNYVLGAHYPTGAGDPSRPDEERLMAPSVLDAVRALTGLVEDEDPGLVRPPGVYGAFSYELVDQWEDLPRRRPDPWNEPDLHLVFALDAVLFDHLRGEVRVITRALDASDQGEADAKHRLFCEILGDGARASEAPSDSFVESVEEKAAEADLADPVFLESVETFLRHIWRGDIFQGVLSRGLSMKSKADPLTVYRVLRRCNPSPYMFHVDVGTGILLGASPETCLKVEGGIVEIRPIAGTAPRGFREDGTIDQELDSRLAVGLLLDHKEQAEHAMLVDLARNDVARVSVAGTRRVASPFSIERYSHVQHLVSGVQGELLPELDALHAYRAAANMGTLSGAPKLRAMELIRETEPTSRGFYGGAVGYCLQDGTFDSCIVIRSLRYRDGHYLTRAGAGIVADSVPERELAETSHKARACRAAVAAAERMVSA